MFLAPWWRQNARIVLTALVAAVLAAAAVYVVEELRLREHRIAYNNHDADLRRVLGAPDVSARTTGLRDGGLLSLITSMERDSAVIVLAEAKPTGLGHAYQIWLLEGADSRSVGLLEPNQVNATLVISGLRQGTTLGVTVEEAAGRRSPTLPLIAELQLPR